MGDKLQVKRLDHEWDGYQRLLNDASKQAAPECGAYVRNGDA